MGMAFRFVRGVVAAGLVMVAGLALAEAPARFNYQAKLNDGDGVPLEGAHTLYFTLFHGGTAGSAGSGSPVFAENAVVAATDGVVSHAVGTGTNTLGGSLTPAMLDFAGDIYLQVAIDTVGNVVLPRTRLDSVPFALSTASQADANGVPPGGIIAAEPGTTFTGFTALPLRIDAGGQWVQRADMPTARRALTAVEMNGRVYVMAGLTTNSGELAITDANEEYDPATNTWATRAPVPTARFLHAAVGAGGKIHLMGGSPVLVTTSSVDHYSYDPAANGWETEADLPAPRYGMAVAAVGAHIYGFGGAVGGGGVTNTTFDYDTATSAWGPARANVPVTRSAYVAGTLDGYAIVTGGFTGSGGSKEVYQFDPIANSWLQLSDMPAGAYNHSVASTGGRLFVIGGFNEGGLRTSRVYAYSRAEDTWLTKARLPVAANLAAAAAVGNRVYCFGGAFGSGDNLEEKAFELNPGILSLHQKD